MKKRLIELGFSLVEMAVVLTIVALLMAGLLPMLSSQMDQKSRTETRSQLEEIRGALVGYALVQPVPKLPCPANPTIATGLTNAGVEARTAGVCDLPSGVLPWVTLGTNETDSWGRRFTYSAPSTFTGVSGFTLSTTSTISVLSASTGGIAIASGVPAVIISHGKNGFGGYTSDGIQISTTDAGPDESDNFNGAPFVSHEQRPDFDDLVVWLSPNTLFNRMVQAGKLP